MTVPTAPIQSAPSQRLTDLGYRLPPVAAPLASYVPARRVGNLIYTSGQLPTVDGALVATGKVGANVSEAEAVECARVCALNALAAIDALVGLDQVIGVVKVVGFVAAASDFLAMPAVINGASDLLGAVFGATGAHARSAVGVAVLPRDAPVEVELIVEVQG
jgi:enamine deaminase RidA (YjgF/YER057c/UK114 family)